jgi:hypothetical protein
MARSQPWLGLQATTVPWGQLAANCRPQQHQNTEGRSPSTNGGGISLSRSRSRRARSTADARIGAIGENVEVKQIQTAQR